MNRELFMAAHDELVEEYLERHPQATEAQAYDRTADLAYDRMRDKYADMADQAMQRAKDAGNRHTRAPSQSGEE